MTETTALELALRAVAGARVQAVRMAADGSASVVIDAEGLDDAARKTLETRLTEAATGAILPPELVVHTRQGCPQEPNGR